jgi:hypothetical protein
MFKVGDIIKCRYGDSTYRYGPGIYIVSEVINNEQMYITLLLDSGHKYHIHSNSSADWILDIVYCRRNKIKKICSRLETR